MKKWNIAICIFWAVAFLVIPLWILMPSETSFRHHINSVLIFSSEACALVGLALFSLSFILSARFKWLESVFNGLDKMYQNHHLIGKTAFFLLLVHPILLALRWFPKDIEKTLWYLLPVHRRLAVNIGSYAWWGLILLITLTIVIRISYDKWKISHKFMGVFFILGALHAYFIELNISSNILLLIYFSILVFFAITAYLYKTVLFDLLRHKNYYQVDKVNRLSGKIMEIFLSAKNTPLRFTPGQYCFFRFLNPLYTRESHPFTICSHPSEQKIRICVKVLGDFTTHLYDKLETGTLVEVEGPYGYFDFRMARSKQIWISGGVGIAPFLSWSKSLEQQPSSELMIDFYYCINRADELIFSDEFEKLKLLLKQFNIHSIIADKEGFLKVSNIPDVHDKDIFICGPKQMRQALLKDFIAIGVPIANIHYEDFVFS